MLRCDVSEIDFISTFIIIFKGGVKMKNIKKLISMLLMLIMVLTMMIPAFATGDTIDMEGPKDGGKITVTPAVSGQTYNLYQILYLESYSITNEKTKAGQYSYKATEAWKAFLQTTDAKKYITLDNAGYATWKDDPTNARAQEFARLALQYAKDNNIKPVKTQKASAASIEFPNLKLGYYLVDTTVGTMCMLDTTNSDFTVEDKNDIPTNVKSVQENGDYKSENDVSIGDIINYKSTIDAKMGAENYILHDDMDDGIDFIEITGINKIDSDTTYVLKAYDPENTDPNQAWDYKLVRPAEGQTTLADGCTFHVEFRQAFLNTILMGSNIDVYYTGKLNQGAVVGSVGNINTSWLSYGEKGDMYTTKSKTTTRTWEFSIYKFAETTTKSRQALAGAKFKLCKTNDVNAASLTFSKVSGVADTYKYDPAGTVTEFTTGTDGLIYLQGLDQATYYLFETAAPDGYNKMTTSVTVVIREGGKVFKNLTEAPNNQIAVENNSGSLLPSTGGIGTTIFYVVGGILLVGAGVLLVVRKRMSIEKDSR